MHFNTDHESLQNGDRLGFQGTRIVGVALLSLPVMTSRTAKHVATSTAPGAKPSVVVSESNYGKSIQVFVGQKLQVRLASNPTTGYSWSVRETPAQLQLTKSDYAADPQGKNAPGVARYQTVEFMAKSAGKGELKLGYRRPREKDTPPARTFSVTITVK
jgi:inhibitor of cysteine peptidase